MNRSWRWVALALIGALGACAAPTPPEPSNPSTLVWPSAPEAARVVFVRSFARPEDLGITKGILQRLAEWFVGPSENHLVRPMAVVASGSTLLVADPGARGVHRFDVKNGDYTLIRAENGAPLPSPVGLALGEAGTVFVADSSLGSVLSIAPGAAFATPVKLSDPPQQPTGIAFDRASQRLFVSDTARHQVRVYGLDGALRSTLGRRGAGSGEFNFPTMIWLGAAGQLLVTDSLNFRTQIFAADGRFVGRFGRPGDSPGDSPRQKGVATDSLGHIYVVDSLLHAVQIFDAAGQLLLSIGGPGQGPGEFWLPTGVFIGEDDVIYVADSFNQRIQVFRYVGGPT
jgi:DNA-binding beta-propeller fold protein YncE